MASGDEINKKLKERKKEKGKVKKTDNRGYLVCDSCGGYYELQKGESPFDFQECECGGNLKYKKPIISSDKTSNNHLEDSNGIKSKSSNIYYLGLLIGVIIIFVGEIFFQNGNHLSYIFDLIGGFVASFIAGGKIKNGVINGLIVGIIGGALASIYIGNFGGITGITGIIAFIIGFSLAVTILSLIGAIIGVSSRKLISKYF